ncbi:MAG: DEAD/DEAH box helicase [Cyanobacteria bacterium P01_F01_bin.143]
MKSTFELNLQELFPFELDEFQHQAIAALNADKSVVVCAPTGSGKTLIGEYAIYRALARGKRVFYTTPLKALSNQKFRDFQNQFGTDNGTSVGLITGDIIINANADIIIMTTEIFRNMLYETPIGQVGTSLENLEVVVLDECHYLGNRGRGTVWEECIIYTPPQIQILALSATVGNPEELTDWIVKVRNTNGQREYDCELVNSDFRPVPLRYFFCDRNQMYPLLNTKQTKLNPKLKSLIPKRGSKRKRLKLRDCPNTYRVLRELKTKDMLPAIYIIFSRRGCDRAVEQLDNISLVNTQEAQQIEVFLLHFFLDRNESLQQALLDHFAQKNPELHNLIREYIAANTDAAANLSSYLTANPNQKYLLWQFLTNQSQIIKIEQVEPLLRGIASHHAGLLPAWKELVERLFELGLVKIVFATATLAAGINMPARTTVISALSKRTDAGHGMLTPSEFLQIAGRAGRRGKDPVGHVVTLQTPFEGAPEAVYLATSSPEPLMSRFTPSYGMVLNLLQKHSLDEVKELLAKSFAEYLAQKKLAPEQQAIAEITTQMAKLDVELAMISQNDFASYQKIKERLQEENRLFDTLKQQAEATRKKAIKPLIAQLLPGRIVGLKGKHIRLSSPLAAVIVTKIPGSGQAENLVCLSIDNNWYVAANTDISEINEGEMPIQELESVLLPHLEKPRLGRLQPGGETSAIAANNIGNYLIPQAPAPEVVAQQQKMEQIQEQLDTHPLNKYKNLNQLLKKQQKRDFLRKKLHKSQSKYQKHKLNQSYYWEDFLNLIKVLQEFSALEEYTPTDLGKAAATIRGDNELWLAIAFRSGELDNLEPHHLAAAVSALVTETPRGDIWCEYVPAPEVLEALGIQRRQPEEEGHTSSLRELRPHLFQVQHRYGVGCPIWREYELVGLSEHWALGVEWNELCENTNLAEGDIVRMLRRTIDVLLQIPQIPSISSVLVNNARDAVSAMKRFPI